MKIHFPESLDPLGLARSRDAHNAAAVSNALMPEDLLYMIGALERKVGADNSADPSSIDFRLADLGRRIDALQSALQGLTGGVPAAAVPTSASSLRSRRVAVAAGNNMVVFSSPVPAGYIILGACYNGAGEQIGFSVSGQTSIGFTVSVDADGFFEWAAIPNL